MADAPDVILLRSPDPSPDRYLEAFDRAGLRAQCEPVLSFSFPCQEALAAHLHPRDAYAALIATSPRVGTALARVFEDRPALATAWRRAPAYAVGPKTAARLRDAGLAPRGADAGSADALAEHIIEVDPAAPLLFLCGNRRRDVLPQRLRDAGVSFDEQVVYTTHTRTDLALPASEHTPWLVFFSPSGLAAVMQSGIDPGAYRCAAIGPTTGGALKEAGHPPAAVADAPTPSALVKTLREAHAA
jgi:uroporphyrinogen-III synthase